MHQIPASVNAFCAWLVALHFWPIFDPSSLKTAEIRHFPSASAAKTVELEFGPQEVALMAAATSPATGRSYGVRRVCASWGVARSSFYDARCQEGRPSPVGRPGPKPALSDAELLAAIRRDLARSPWTGEGHRKVWARLRVIDGIRVGRARLLRV